VSDTSPSAQIVLRSGQNWHQLEMSLSRGRSRTDIADSKESRGSQRKLQLPCTAVQLCQVSVFGKLRSKPNFIYRIVTICSE